MATFKDPIKCFAPIEVVERLIEIRIEYGYAPAVFVPNTSELANLLDAFGFDSYAFSTKNKIINYGDYRAPIVPGGDSVHCSITAH